MHDGNIKNVDLNLLKVLDELLRQKNVTRAGDKLGLSQPAVSRALGRLRHVFGDSLFVRSGRNFTPTPLALQLQGRLSKVLEDTRELIRPRAFDPALETGVIRVNAPDATTLVLMSRVFGELGRSAPNLEFVVTNSPTDRISALAKGDLDLAIDFFEQVPPGHHRQCLMEDEVVAVTRHDHPMLRQARNSKQFFDQPHIRLATASSRFIEETLARRDIRPFYALTVPNFIVAAATVSETDWLLMLPSNLAQRLRRMFDVAILELPIDVPDIPLDMVWHERLDHDPCQSWIRGEISRIAQAGSGELLGL